MSTEVTSLINHTSKTGTVFLKQMSGMWYCDMRYLDVMSGECLYTTDEQMHVYTHKHTHTHTQTIGRLGTLSSQCEKTL